MLRIAVYAPFSVMEDFFSFLTGREIHIEREEDGQTTKIQTFSSEDCPRLLYLFGKGAIVFNKKHYFRSLCPYEIEPYYDCLLAFTRPTTFQMYFNELALFFKSGKTIYIRIRAAFKMTTREGVLPMSLEEERNTNNVLSTSRVIQRLVKKSAMRKFPSELLYLVWTFLVRDWKQELRKVFK